MLYRKLDGQGIREQIMRSRRDGQVGLGRCLGAVGRCGLCLQIQVPYFEQPYASDVISAKLMPLPHPMQAKPALSTGHKPARAARSVGSPFLDLRKVFFGIAHLL